MSKHVFYVTAIIFLAIVCVVDYMRINKLQEELTDARKQIEEEFDAVEWKLDASIYKKDAQLLLMNQNFGNPNIHKMLTDSCHNDCLKYRKKYGKEGTE
jgi:hypothetical protein